MRLFCQGMYIIQYETYRTLALYLEIGMFCRIVMLMVVFYGKQERYFVINERYQQD